MSIIKKTIDFRLIGGILLIIGTSIGGGMLALPISNSPVGFVGSTLLLIFAWVVMTLGAFAILEVNRWLPSGSNLISMAKATLGVPGKIITWIVYLFLLYALLSAYIAGGSDVFQLLLDQFHIDYPTSINVLLFVFIFGTIVYSGIRTVDYANRVLMFGKLGTCLLLIFLITPYIHGHFLLKGLVALRGNTLGHVVGGVILVLITSFGFATIVPSLRVYYHDDAAKLRKAVLIGSLIPLVIYIAWDAVIMGVIPREHEHGLLSLLHSQRSTSELTNSLMIILDNAWIGRFFEFFTSICMLTAFLGVSLGLFDFLADGLHIPRKGPSGLFIALIAYVPPVVLVLFCPGIFISALRYAGLFCVILLLFLPLLMTWSGRYIKRLDPHAFKKKKWPLVTLLIISIALMALAIP